MKAKLYPFKSYIHGFYIQRNVCDEVIEGVTKKQLIDLADLRHPILTESEYFKELSTDIDGKPKQEFELMSNTHLIIVTR